MEEPPGQIICLAEYEDKRINSDTNFAREDIIDVERWGDLVKSHTEKFIKKGIIIQYTMADCYVMGYGDYNKALEFLLPYRGHIIIETENEFLNNSTYVDRALEIEAEALSMGFIVSGGAWGRSHHGKANAIRYLEKSKAPIANMHRPYPPESEYITWIRSLVDLGKIPIENEFLIDNPKEVEKYARLIIKEGGHFNAYVGDYLELMGKLAKEFN